MLLQVKNFSGGYQNRQILHSLSFNMHRGQILCLLGPNGCGKTTLLKGLMGFLPYCRGEIYLEDQPLHQLSPKARARLVAYIPQAHVPEFDYLVYDMVLMGRTCYLETFAQPSQKDQDLAYRALQQLGIEALAHREYTRLSGGQRQLVLIARALCQQAPLLIMDEPSADLDFANQQLISQTIRQLKQQNYSIILSTHAPEYPFSTADQVLLLHEGRILGQGAPLEVLTAQSLQQVYGIPMDVVQVLDSKGQLRRFCLPL